MTRALLIYLHQEQSQLSKALNEGALLGRSNDQLTQDYASIVGRQTQIAHIVTLDLESLLELLPEEEIDE